MENLNHAEKPETPQPGHVGTYKSHRIKPGCPAAYLIWWLTGAILLYILNRIGSSQIPTWPAILRYYGGDFLALPVYLPWSAWLAVRFRLVPAEYRLNWGHVLLAALLFGLLFEGLLPMVDGHSQADIFDVLAYLLGGFAFLAGQKYLSAYASRSIASADVRR